MEANMAPRYRIRCVNKIPREDPHKSIVNVGGTTSGGGTWKQSQKQTVEEIEAGKCEFYVDEAGREVDVIVATHNGHKYIKTRADRVGENNLLKLPECP
jgi:hypothetical protein